MTATLHALPALTPQAPSPWLIPAAETLAAEGVTPDRVRSWDAYRDDPDRADLACERLAGAVGRALAAHTAAACALLLPVT